MRHLSPYERNHLLKYGFDPNQIDQWSEMPVEYITGRVDFGGHEFKVSGDVLIPRVETEELVRLVVADFQPGFSLIDIGTGSGVIGLSVWLGLRTDQREQAKVILSDISEAVLEISRVNKRVLTEDSPQIAIILK